MSQLLSDLSTWLDTRPGLQASDRTSEPSESPQALQTGPELVDRIVRAIELDQSVLLTGPRGCGKSRCIREAIKEAQARGIIPPGASVFLQGNREIPRDYLAEDEISFTTRSVGQKLEVSPDIRSAPLFRFARRDPSTRGVEYIDEKRGEIRWDLPSTNGAPSRFVLFLDEINRFSDGVLDSLLSVLEERIAVLGGKEHQVPVVVCMTMNPPGYDGSARRLSPPLAARIGRCFRLATPDLATLSDIILPDRLDRARTLHAASHPGLPFPEISPDVSRLAALVTLCLWGDLSLKKTGGEYLTAETHEFLRWAVQADADVRQAMQGIGDLCQFGPDGRAVGDWAVAAIGAALQESRISGAPVLQVEERHFLQTVVESVAHKIYDNFSPASRPDLTIKKEVAIRRLTERIFKLGAFERKVARDVDDLEFWKREGADDPIRLRQIFLGNRVTDPEEVLRWRSFWFELEQISRKASADQEKGQVARALIRHGLAQRSPDGEECVFSAQSSSKLALALLEGMSLEDGWSALLRSRFPLWSVERNLLRQELELVEPIADYLKAERFLEICDELKLDRLQRRQVVQALEDLWNGRLTLAKSPVEKVVEDSLELEVVTRLDAPAKSALIATLHRLEDQIRQQIQEAERPPEGRLARVLARLRTRQKEDGLTALRQTRGLLSGLLAGLEGAPPAPDATQQER